jgi:competence protein ComEC
LGKKTALDRELIDAYARAGVIHVLAISGLHVGIIMLFLGFVLSPLQWLPKGKWIHTLSILLLLWGFGFFTGGSPYVVRAVTMFSAFAVAKYSQRIHSTFHLLVVSFFSLLVVYPPFVYQVGFQMSYLAELGIITIHPLIQKYWSPKLLILKKFWQLTTVCLAAQIAVAPLSIYYFHQFPGLFLLSNWIILPFFGMFLIFGMGLLLLIAFDTEILPLFEGFDRIIDLMNQAIFWVACQEAFLFQNIPLSIPVLLGFYLLMFLIY